MGMYVDLLRDDAAGLKWFSSGLPKIAIGYSYSTGHSTSVEI